MGLDFTFRNRRGEEMPHWSYGGFNRFRDKVAKEIGINLYEMKGFCPISFSENEAVEWNKKAKDWKTVESPIKHFLSHSDCDGQLSSKRCGAIAPILGDLIKNWPEDDFDKQEAKLLIKTMNRCYMKRTPLIFT